MGTGRFAALLPYDQWLAFANAQRAHYNYVEGAASAIFLTVGAGLYNPRVAAMLGAAYVRVQPVPAPRPPSKNRASPQSQAPPPLTHTRKHHPANRLLQIVGREAFAAGYAAYGPNKRMAGALILDLSLLGCLGLTSAGGLKHAKLM